MKIINQLTLIIFVVCIYSCSNIGPEQKEVLSSKLDSYQTTESEKNIKLDLELKKEELSDRCYCMEVSLVVINENLKLGGDKKEEIEALYAKEVLFCKKWREKLMNKLHSLEGAEKKEFSNKIFEESKNCPAFEEFDALMKEIAKYGPGDK